LSFTFWLLSKISTKNSKVDVDFQINLLSFLD
jgi:hypothetical protein